MTDNSLSKCNVSRDNLSKATQRMIKDRTIICIASNWDLDPTSKHHVMRILAQHNTVLWMNYRGTRRPRISMIDIINSLKTLRQVAAGPKRVNENFVHFTPLVIPGVKTGPLARINEAAFIAQTKRILKRYADPEKPVQVWSFAPDVGFLAGKLNEERFIYYCVDEFKHFRGFDEIAIRNAERLLIKNADLVITSSNALFESKGRIHQNVHMVRHGVDVDHFATASHPDTAPHEEIADLKGPIIGFFGLIHDWVDLELIYAVIKRMPNANFVFIGEVFEDIRRIAALPNVRFIDRRPYSMLPAFCAAFDVAILPFKCDEMTKFINPIKLREYLAAGLPVVSTPLPEAEIYAPHVKIAQTVDEFVDACNNAIDTDTEEMRTIRANLMKSESWSSTVQRLCDIVGTNGHGPLLPENTANPAIIIKPRNGKSVPHLSTPAAT